MAKRIALVVVLAMVGAGCQWLAPRPGFGPILEVRVSPPGAAGARTVTVSAADVAPDTQANTTVQLDGKDGPIIASGSRLPLTFTFDVGAAGPGTHSFWVRSRIGDEKRRGIGYFTGGIRLNQLQALGSHNSYHTYPEPGIAGIESLQYFEDPLDVQLESQGVRQFELDINVNTDGTFSVVHVQGIDEGTTCRAFLDCLATIRTWSDAHPQHVPIAVLLELKDNDFGVAGVPYHNWTAADLDPLDATLRSVFPEDRLFTPDDLRRHHATLPAAISIDGWPEIDAVRGQVMFMMDNGGTFRSWYRAGHAGLAGRVIFTNANPGDDDAAFVKRNSAKGSFADIQALVAQGYVVRTRTDSDTVEARTNDTTTREAALASGAQWVSTDYVVPGRAFGTDYFVQIPGGTPARCNPINSPSWCTSNLVESLP